MNRIDLKKLEGHLEAYPQGLTFEEICSYLQIEESNGSYIIFESLVKYSKRMGKIYVGSTKNFETRYLLK